MTALAQLFLMLTSLAPVGLVYAGVVAGNRAYVPAIILVSVSAVLLAVCVGLLWRTASVCAPVPKQIADPTTKESEPLAFLVAYALPLVSAKPGEGSIAGLAVFVVLMGLALWQQQVFHANPLLAMLGFQFFAAKSDSGAAVLVLSRNKLLSPGVLSVVRLSDYLWLDWPKNRARRDGVAAGDSA